MINDYGMMSYMVIYIYIYIYIDKIDDNSSVQQAFNKSTQATLKGFFITHIEGDPVSSTKDAAKKLEQLFQEHLLLK